MALSSPPRIARIEPLPVRVPRDREKARGTAGSPTELGEVAGAYRWSDVVNALYPTALETALVKVTLNDGTYGWGEAQAPLAPRVAAVIIEDLLAPVLVGEAFDGTPQTIERLWSRQYHTMRVRGQTGGFMLDAISGVDLALWDLAGKLQWKPVARLIAPEGTRTQVRTYLTGLAGPDEQTKIRSALDGLAAGFGLFKVYHDSDAGALLHCVDALQPHLEGKADLAVDALWRLRLPEDEPLLRELDTRSLRWLECPFPPEEHSMHLAFAREYSTPLALGETYRTVHELNPFLESGAVRVLQPDLGRCGITGALRIAREAAVRSIPICPHVSIAFGPQIAAAIHVSAALANVDCCEYNPSVFEASNRFLAEPLRFASAAYVVPEAPGLGVEVIERDLTSQGERRRIVRAGAPLG